MAVGIPMRTRLPRHDGERCLHQWSACLAAAAATYICLRPREGANGDAITWGTLGCFRLNWCRFQSYEVPSARRRHPISRRLLTGARKVMNSLQNIGFARCREVEELSQPRCFASPSQSGHPGLLLLGGNPASKGKSQRLLALTSPSISFIAAVMGGRCRRFSRAAARGDRKGRDGGWTVASKCHVAIYG